jgi:mRNA-degrading endonuclease RelE of RelBE toxin-antitoxin system
VREFKKLDGRNQRRIRGALERLARDVVDSGRISEKAVKTLRGTDSVFHRMRLGDHRVMYDFITADRMVLVLGIVDRADLERWLRSR